MSLSSFVLLLLAIVAVPTIKAELDYQFTNQIAASYLPEYCTVHQASEITLLACPKSFEVYKTQDLTLSPYSLVNSGESVGIRYVRSSLETGK